MAESPSVEPRIKRQRVDKHGRFAALQQLKDCKGKKGKHKLAISEEVDNVYDVVDEKEFAKRTQNYRNDWIEDDGTGYLEDGRDVFDVDDDEEQNTGGNEEKTTKSKTSKKRLRDGDKIVKGKGSLRNMFNNAMPKKKKDGNVDLAQDDVLADILGELDTDKSADNKDEASKKSSTTSSARTNHKSDAIIAKEYMQNFMNTIIRKQEPKNDKNESSDDEMIDRILKPKQIETTIVSKKTENVTLSSKKIIEEEPINKLVTENNVQSSQTSNHNDKVQEIHKNQEVQEKNDEKSQDDNLDYSILNEENKFEDDTSVEVQQNLKGKNIDENKDSRNKLEEDETKKLLNNWENICQLDNFDEEISASIQTAPETESADAKMQGNLKFYYWDAYEDIEKRPGQIFLFGKIKSNDTSNDYKSICVHVQNVERVIYLLPREFLLDPITKKTTTQEVTFLDVYEEFDKKFLSDAGITLFTTKKVTKHFAFHVPGIEVPKTCEYLEVRYGANKPAPNMAKQYDSIAYIFGTNGSFLETFLLERKIKGPCWLNIKNFNMSENQLSWCKVEAICSNPTHVSLDDDQKTSPPPVSLLTVYVRSAFNIKTQKNQIVMISCLVNNKFHVDKPAPNPPFNRHFCGFTRPINQNWPLDFQQKLNQYKSTKVTKLDCERSLLSWFLATYQNIDPDLVVTHDVNDLQFDVICDRIAALKIPMWSRLGRLRVSQIFGKKIKDFFIGRMVCDVKSSAEELIKSRAYDLETLCLTVLKLKEGERMEISNDELLSMYETSEALLKLITLTMQDCSYILRLMCELNVLPLALQITNICGNLISRTLQGGRSERNEFLLLHAFTEKDYIVPDKKKKIWDNNYSTTQQEETGTSIPSNSTNNTAPRKKAAFSGGLVLEPIKGLYDKYILLMDFNSLYPSIIQEFNICYTTVVEPENINDIPVLPESTIVKGILPRQIKRLVDSRREVKKLMSTPDLTPELKMQYNIRQLALKLTANSMYGCLGFAQSRFFAQHLASLVTGKGREILMNTKSIVQKLNFEVIYGDTDSIMINTNSTDYDQVFKIGHSIKQTVNKTYRQIELDIDGVFKSLLLLKKKKYAAVTITKSPKGELLYKQEHKGLDIVRRDWSQIAVMAGKLILNEILSDNQLDEKIDSIHMHLERFKQNLLDGTVPLPLLTITKQLTKQPKEYSSRLSLPHVLVALRMNETKNKRYKKGDMIGYIICQDGTDNAAMQRAYHIDEIKCSETLKIDTQYYLAQQIHPVVFRLCEPLDGTDGSRIAQCLGLDPSKFKAAAQRAQRDEGGAGISISKTNLQKYRQCEKFIFKCVACKQDNVVASAFRPFEKTHIPVLQKCSNVDCNTTPPHQYIISIRNQMILSIRQFIQRFYDNWMICDEPTCNNNSRTYSHFVVNNRPICLLCKRGYLVRSYSARDLYHQLSYFHYMFDLSKHEQKNIIVPSDVEPAYNLLKETIENLLEKSAYCTINLSTLFKSFNHW